MTSAPSRSPATFRLVLLGGLFLLSVFAPPSSRADAAADAMYKGQDALKKSSFDLAIANFSEAIRLSPKLTAAYGNRGNVYNIKGDYDKAVADYTEVIRLDPNDFLAYSNRGHAYTDKGDYDRAIADLSNAIRLNPTDAWSYNYRGVAYYSKNNYDKAIADYTEAIRLNSNEAEAYINVARLWAVCPDAKLRNGVKAIEYAKKACELANWKNAYAIDTLAAACAETGNFDEAVKLENKYLKFPLSKEAAIEACQRLSLYEQKKPYHEEKKNYQ